MCNGKPSQCVFARTMLSAVRTLTESLPSRLVMTFKWNNPMFRSNIKQTQMGFFICKSTNESTIIINIKIIRLLHVSTPNVSSSVSLLCYFAKLHKYNYNFCKSCNLPDDDTFDAETCRSVIIFIYSLF